MIIVGVDEAGVGCLAGPLIITAAAFDEKTKLSKDIKDSKRLSSRKREELIDEIYDKAEWIIVEVIPVSFINSCSNVWSAWTIGMTKLLKSCLKRINTVNTLDVIIVDGKRTTSRIRGITYKVKADVKYKQVSAASIVAKYFQTLNMLDIHEEYPMYGFCKHNGYSTSYHKRMLKKYGPTEHHRLKYAPVREVLLKQHPQRQKELINIPVSFIKTCVIHE